MTATLLRKLDAAENRAAFDPQAWYDDAIRDCQPGSTYEIQLAKFDRPNRVRYRLNHAAERILHRTLEFSASPQRDRHLLRFRVGETITREENPA